MDLEIGVDLVDMGRLEKVLQRRGFYFLNRFLLPSEILACRKILIDAPGFINAKGRELSMFSKAKASSYEGEVAGLLESMKSSFEIKDYRLASIAGLWAIKEALSKALGVGIGDRLAFHDICVYKDLLGRPCVSMLDERVSSLEEEGGYKLRGIKASLSHDGGMAMASCVVLFD